MEVDYTSHWAYPYTPLSFELQNSWLLAWVANLLVWADQVSWETQTSTDECLTEVEIMVEVHSCFLYAGFENLTLNDPRHSHPLSTDEIVHRNSQKSPLFTFQHVDDIGDLVSQFRQDLWNWLSQDFSVEVTFYPSGIELSFEEQKWCHAPF